MANSPWSSRMHMSIPTTFKGSENEASILHLYLSYIGFVYSMSWPLLAPLGWAKIPRAPCDLSHWVVRQPSIFFIDDRGGWFCTKRCASLHYWLSQLLCNPKNVGGLCCWRVLYRYSLLQWRSGFSDGISVTSWCSRDCFCRNPSIKKVL